MKMNFQSNSKKKKIVRYSIIGVLIIGGLYLGIGVPSFLGGAAQGAAAPLWRSGGFLGSAVASVTSLFRSKRTLISEYEEMQQTVRDLQLELLDRNILKEENRELKSMLRRVDESDTVLAYVLAKPNRAPYDTLVLDIGSDDGVHVGDQIFVGNIVVIGELVEVFGKTSKAILYSSPNQKVPVVIGRDGVHATAHGIGGGNFVVEVPRDITIWEDDPIVAPGISASVFGVVEDVDINPADAFQIVRFRVPVNIFELDTVLVHIGAGEVTKILESLDDSVSTTTKEE